MPLGRLRLRIREPPAHRAKQALPIYALQGATVAGVCIDHGGPPALRAQQHQRPAPVPKTAGPSRLTPCRLSAVTLKLGLGLLGIPSLERMGAAGCVGFGGAIPPAGPPRQTP
jgi:hypothetical protein